MQALLRLKINLKSATFENYIHELLKLFTSIQASEYPDVNYFITE